MVCSMAISLCLFDESQGGRGKREGGGEGGGDRDTNQKQASMKRALTAKPHHKSRPVQQYAACYCLISYASWGMNRHS